jgi:hypothetical protein
MERCFAAMLAILLACTSQVCHARQWEVSPLVGYTFGGHFEEEDTGTGLDIKESPSVALAVDVEYEPDTQIEFYYSRQATKLKADGDLFSDDTLFDLDVHYIQIGGTYMWQEKENGFQPYIAGTLGVTYFDPRDSDYDPAIRPSMSLGLGTRFWITQHIGIRAEGRGFATFFNSSGSVFSNSEGLTIHVKSDAIGQFVFNTGIFFDF